MADIMKDFKSLIEDATGILCYPLRIPEEAQLPATSYNVISSSRNADSNLAEQNIKSQVLTVKLQTKNVADLFHFIGLIEELDGGKGVTGGLVIRHQNTVTSFSQSSKKCAAVIDLEVRYLKNKGA